MDFPVPAFVSLGPAQMLFPVGFHQRGGLSLSRHILNTFLPVMGPFAELGTRWGKFFA